MIGSGASHRCCCCVHSSSVLFLPSSFLIADMLRRCGAMFLSLLVVSSSPRGAKCPLVRCPSAPVQSQMPHSIERGPRAPLFFRAPLPSRCAFVSCPWRHCPRCSLPSLRRPPLGACTSAAHRREQASSFLFCFQPPSGLPSDFVCLFHCSSIIPQAALFPSAPLGSIDCDVRISSR